MQQIIDDRPADLPHGFKLTRNSPPSSSSISEPILTQSELHDFSQQGMLKIEPD